MKTYRIGVIGAGAIAQNAHIPGYAKAENCELVAIADPLKRCRDEVRSKGYSFAKEYTDYKKMLKQEKLDVISVCTPNYLHKEMAIAAIRKGCTVLLEKPVAMNMREANAIAKEVEKHQTRLMVSFTHRFNMLNVKAREAVKKGKIGKPYMARIRFAHTGPTPGWAKTDWFYDPIKAGGGAMMDMAIHAIDLIQWYIEPATSIQAKVATLRKKIKVDDNAVALLEFGSKCLGYIEVGWTSPSGFCGVEIMGDKGAITVDYNAQQTSMTCGVRKPNGENKMESTLLCDKNTTSAWIREMEYFTANLGKRKPFDITIHDGVAALKVAVAAYKSNSTGKKIKIS